MQIENRTHADLVLETMSNCTDVLTQEFCDNANYGIIDAWLLRKHASAGGSTVNYFADSGHERVSWYDGISAVDARLVFMAFSDLVGHAVRSEHINFESFKHNCLLNFESLPYMRRVEEAMDRCFREFLTELLFPWLVDKRTRGKPFLKKFVKLMFDDDVPDIDFFEFKHFITLIESISRAKRIFCKYYMGAYPYLDGFNGVYTPHERISKIKKGTTNTRISDESIEGMFCRVFGESGDREQLSSMYLEGDMQTFFAYCNLPLTKELMKSGEAVVKVMGGVKGIFDNYILKRGTPQGELLRATLCQMAIDWSNNGGKVSSD